MKTFSVLLLLEILVYQASFCNGQSYAFGSAYYQFCLTSLTPSTIVGQITTNQSPTQYRITAANSNLAIDLNTGVIALINYVLSGTVQVLQISATNSAGQVLTTNFIVSATIPCSSSAVTAVTVSVTTLAPVAATTVVVVGAPVFQSSYYTFIPGACSVGSLIGTMSATASGPVTYAVSGSSAFSFTSASNGNLYLTGPAPGTNPSTFTVVATNTASGVSKSVPVAVYLTCPSTIAIVPTIAPTAAPTPAATALITTRATTRLVPTVAGAPPGVDLG